MEEPVNRPEAPLYGAMLDRLVQMTLDGRTEWRMAQPETWRLELTTQDRLDGCFVGRVLGETLRIARIVTVVGAFERMGDIGAALGIARPLSRVRYRLEVLSGEGSTVEQFPDHPRLGELYALVRRKALGGAGFMQKVLDSSEATQKA